MQSPATIQLASPTLSVRTPDSTSAAAATVVMVATSASSPSSSSSSAAAADKTKLANGGDGDRNGSNSSGSSSAAAAATDVARYDQLLRDAWRDLPDLTVEYRDLAYTPRIPIAANEITSWPAALLRVHRLFQAAPSRDLPALHPVSGIVRPGTMTLVLAPPGQGKSTFLKSLAGLHQQHGDPNLRGSVLYNGLTFDEAVAKGVHVPKLTAFVDQGDIHLSLLTVRETLQFALDNAAADPALLGNPELAALHAKKVDLVLELLGLKECENTILGNEMLRGVSGGQRRRVSIGEMLITNARLLLLDEITTGLDSAASLDILSAIRKWTRVTHGSCVTTLLQPTPECFAQFDNLILLRQGHVIYDGPRDQVQAYLESIGVPVPPDQDLADFLVDFLNDPKAIYVRSLYRRARRAELAQAHAQAHAEAQSQHRNGGNGAGVGAHAEHDREIVAERELAHEHADDAVESHALLAPQASPETGTPLGSALLTANAAKSAATVPLTTNALVAAFRASSFYATIQAELQRLQANRASLAAALDPSKASAFSRAQLYSSVSHSLLHHLELNVDRQWKYMKRNVGFFMPRMMQSVVFGLIIGSLFWQVNPSDYATRYGLILLMPVFIAFANIVELPFAAESKLVIFKQVDSGFYPTLAYSLSVQLVHCVLATSETILFCTIVYYMSGFDASGDRWIFFVFAVFITNLCMSVMFRTVSYLTRMPDIAEQCAGPLCGIFMMFAGFMVTERNVPDWFIWIYWLSPFSWTVRALAQNEMFAARYPDKSYLAAWDFDADAAYKWAAIGYLAGMFLIFAALSTAVLASKRFPLTVGTRRMLADEEEEEALNARPEEQVKLGEAIKPEMLRRFGSSFRRAHPGSVSVAIGGGSGGAGASASSTMPFQPVDLAWRNIKYTVQVKSSDGKSTVDRVLLTGINGFARAGTMTALMGSSGAGKTTLLDVLAGRKTTGKIEGDIMLNGYATAASTFKRVSGYVEQTDVHLATQTVREALRFSARLRLPREVPEEQMLAFVEEVLTILELAPIADRLIGDVTRPGLSPGQLKRVTIGVELVANPPLLFLDEPTSGLDSRAALIVMRVVKRIAQTGRAVVCTIHQPSAELFFLFDRLLLLQSGGISTFFGDLGEEASSLVEYFETAPVAHADLRPKLPPRTNPASWMLDVIGAGTGAKLKARGLTKADLPDYAALYRQSALNVENESVLRELTQPRPGTAPLHFETAYASTYATQYWMVLSRAFQYYWRSSAYMITRFITMIVLSLLFGLLTLDISQNSLAAVQSKIANVFLGNAFPGYIMTVSSISTLFRYRAVFYRERASQMYTSPAHATAIMLIETFNSAICSMIFLIPFYFLVGFQNDAALFFQFYLSLFLCMICFTAWAQLLVAALPNLMVANIANGSIGTFVFLFAGLFIPVRAIPVGWKWFYYMLWLSKALTSVSVSQFECTASSPDSPNCGFITVPNADGDRLVRVDQYVYESLDTSSSMYWPFIGWLILTVAVLQSWVYLATAKVNHQLR